ncbi:sigma-54 dependent transcriptional regulator [Opitutia bacterium ISCC 51]|nr:sigma-54 dependent transcriptional regulator [Opitutae bacterium ISCC 51]QXD27866.1 sigma-54 dependent transcriptional regulator [Opitutae bacterium ISCC 52]
MPASILIVDDEKHTREGLQMALEDDYDVYLASDADQAFNLLDSQPFDVVLTDLRMSGKSGLKVIDYSLTMSQKPICIMMTAYGNVETAVEAMKRGAFDFLTKPVNLERLEILIKRAINSKQIQVENKELHQRLDQKFSFKGIIGNSAALEVVIERVKLVAPSKATVLVEGETGTGKELIAQAIHQNSDRSRKAFVAVNCAALPTNLLESELFGHEKGAFTGAIEKRVGRFEASHNGTLFLDEIGEIDAATQVKLLRFLESKTFERVGSIKPIEVDVRLVCATNQNLKQLVENGDFREDLYYRLNVVSIFLPPLRERQQDIPLLLSHFLKYYAKDNGVPLPDFDAAAIRVLQDYKWPGNIRELRNFAENTVVLHLGGTITEYDLDNRFREGAPVSVQSEGVQSNLSVEENEKHLLRKALLQAKGNRTKAAELMGISRRTLHRKLVQWPELDTTGRAGG